MGRFWVEMFRPDAWRMGQLATAQWIAIGFIVFGVVAIIINHLRPRRISQEPVVNEPAAEPTGEQTNVEAA